MARGMFGEWLDNQYLKWQLANGGRRTLDDFAEFLGIGSRVTLSRWINGKSKPERESIEILASKLGPEIYDRLGMERPDPGLQLVIQAWGKYTDDEVADAVRTAKLALERISPSDSAQRLAKNDGKRKAGDGT